MTIPPEVSNAQQGSVLFSFIHSYINVNDRAQKSVFPISLNWLVQKMYQLVRKKMYRRGLAGLSLT